MIKRITPDAPKISIKDFKEKRLKPTQVIDPNLTSEQVASFQKQVHKESFVELALKRVEKEIKPIDPISEEDDAYKDELSDEQIIKFLAEEETRRGSKLFDPTAFARIVARTTPEPKPSSTDPNPRRINSLFKK